MEMKGVKNVGFTASGLDPWI